MKAIQRLHRNFTVTAQWVKFTITALAVFTFHRSYAADEVVVKVGVATTLTGVAAHLGKDEENGARLAVEDINRDGIMVGPRRVRLELVSEDDAGDPRLATTAAQRLVDENVVAVVGHMNSGTSIPAARVYAQAHVAQVSPSATNPVFTHQGFATTFRVVATDESQGPALAEYASNALRIRSVAIIDDSSAYGVGLADSFERSAKLRGIRVLSHDAASDHTVDFRAVLTRLKAERPDALVFGGMDETGALLVRQAAALSLNIPIVAGDGICGDDFPKLAGPAANQVVCSIAGAALSGLPSGKAFELRYQKRFGEPILGYAAFAYDAVRVIAAAIVKAGSVERPAVLAALHTTDYAGVTGRIRFDSNGDIHDPVIAVYGYQGMDKILKAQLSPPIIH
ncbi:branched-chain amino acid ABC transporter substrate-binding protein [Paraburkholderia flava]|uniref:branched-chain amino acid ABC transporter substrate-binding protein n=1 Tax=Paraburkholderia flava TaxID=2547393 RepID=UPI001061254D|nr:branched-chain amino acid ABC transporter substrate-binding protein [Paraburkholderia flava]